MTIKDNPIDTTIDEVDSKVNLNLDQFHGTSQYYKHFTGLKYTDGIKYLADKTECYWFIDIIASYQHRFGDIQFQLWTLRVFKDRTAVVIMKEDSDKEPLVSQDIDYTDFPLDEIEVYCINGVILLKSEY